MGSAINTHSRAPGPKIIWLLVLLLLLLIIGLNACKTCEKCPEKEKEVVKTDSSTKETEHPADSNLVPFYVEGPIRYLPSPCANLCDSLGKLKPFSAKDTKNGITSHTYSKGDTLVNDCHADSILQVTKRKDREIRFNKEVIRTLIKEKIVQAQLTRFEVWRQQTYKYGFWSLLIILILSFVLRRWLKSIPWP